MQEQAVFREKYNFVKFEVLRIKSLLGGRKETAERKNSDDVSIRETIGEILSELKIYALKPSKKLLLVSAVCGISSGIAPYLRMLYMGELPELLSGTTEAIVIFSIFMALSEINGYLWSVFFMYSGFFKSEMTDLYDNALQAKNYVEILHKPRALFVVNSVESMLSFAKEIFQYKRSVLNELLQCFREAITFVICTFSLFAIVPQLALFMVLLQLISMEFVLYNNKFFRTVDERFRLFSQKISRETGDVSGQASLVQSANKVEKESGRIYAKLMKSSALKRLKYCNRRIGEKSFYLVLEAVGAVAVCYVAIADIIKTGDIGRLALISGAAVQMKIRCETLLRSYLSIDEYKNKIADIRKRMQLPKVLERGTGNNRLSAADNFIRLENVSFAYPALKRLEDAGFLTEVKYGNTVLENVTLDVRAGGVTVVAGTSGQGKSTLMRLIRHDYDVQQGEVFIGTQNVCDLPDEEINRHIAFIGQNVRFFDTSVRRNLTYFSDVTDEKRIREVLDAAGLTEDIAHFEGGLDYKIGINGNKLSGGQRQRLALARTFLTNRPIVIMDEPTTGLDQVMSFQIMKALKELAKDKTVLLVTHNPTEIALADRVLIIKGKHIVADGEPLNLIENTSFLKSAMTRQDILSKKELFIAHCRKTA